ncbi:helitron helicase-like domain-containing protein [Artemisia annua]|uniref:Helitron helicase-like domain-containing protein n=1 Tax=Artemisia annua TaxID=35608 RepID=A0A2U1MAK4_ARTAN|nr:helitron helicase-like domain-containing protein [Artemisia annua]
MKTKQKAIRRIPSPTSVPAMDFSPGVEHIKSVPSSLKRKQPLSDTFDTNAITHHSGSSSRLSSIGEHVVSDLYRSQTYETHESDSVTIRQNGSSSHTEGTQQHLYGSNNTIEQNSNQRRRLRQGPPSTYISMGSCTEVCKHCKAFFWYDERVKKSNRNRPEYHRCCNNGKVILETTKESPPYIKELFQDRHFMENIRAYNQMFAMTSLGVELDDSINRGRGPYVFKVSGKIYHWIGSMCPEVNKEPKSLQLYIYDTANEVKHRLDHFNKSETRLRRDIVENLIQILDNHNELVKLFRTARDKMEGVDVPNFKVKLFGVVGSRQYDLPAGDSIGAIVFEGGPDVGTNYDVIIEKRGGKPQRIDKLNPHYMSLHFPILFIHGEEGYHLGEHVVSDLYRSQTYETHESDSVTIRQNGSSSHTEGTQQHLYGSNNTIEQNSNQRRRLRQGPPSTYISMGSCTEVCKHCKAFFWYDERVKKSNRNRPEYHRCCNNGKVILETTKESPPYIKELFQDRHFMENIRAYNQMFSMTSLGVELDDSINRGRGPYVFKVSGKLYHWIGSMCPEVNKEPKFLQLYIYDTANEVKHRLDHFNKSETRLRRDIVENLIQILDNHNELVKLFRTARDKMEGVDVPNFKVKLFGVVGSRQYDLPAGDSIGAIVFEGGLDVGTNYDVIIENAVANHNA